MAKSTSKWIVSHKHTMDGLGTRPMKSGYNEGVTNKPENVEQTIQEGWRLRHPSKLRKSILIIIDIYPLVI